MAIGRVRSQPLQPDPHPQSDLPPCRPARTPACAFAIEVKARVAEHFAAAGTSTHADPAMVLKSLIMVGTYAAAYLAILGGPLPLWAAWALCPVIGVAMAGIGFCVAHDALHGSYASDCRVNRALGWLFESIGANGYAWRLSHNGAHHVNPNVLGLDEDVSVTPLLRLHAKAPRRAIHRFQHWFALPLYALTTLNWVVVKDFVYFGQSLVGGRTPIPPAGWAQLIVGKLGYYALLAAPFFLGGYAPVEVVVGIVTVHLTSGVIVGGVFQLAHVVEATEHHDDADAAPRLRAEAFAHQLRTTCNFAPGARLLTWYLGGLNHQVEHHLFPRMCHVHYPRIAPIVREAALRHGLPYHSIPTLGGAVASHLRTLRSLGAAPARTLAAQRGRLAPSQV